MPPSSWFSRIRLARYPANASLPVHRHAGASLVLVAGGGYEERIRGRGDWHRPGEMLLCPADEPHSQVFAGEGALKIQFDLRGDTLDYLRGRVALAEAPFFGSSRLAALASRLRGELSDGIADATSRLAVEGLALEALAEFGRHAGVAERVAPWLQRARDYVQAHAQEGFELEQMARELGRHPTHVARSFRAAFGCSVGGMVRKLRMDEAVRLLRATRRPIAEIAAECGFVDQSHFTRSFRAFCGITPARFRREQR